MSVLEDLENLFYGRTPPTDVEIQSALRQWKNSVRVATTAAGTLATSFAEGQTVDGVVLVEGDRILIKNQASGIENGIYNVSASGAPSRASDMEATTDAASVVVYVNEGTALADTVWACTDDSFTEVGVDAITFEPFLPGAGTDTDAIHDNVAGEIQLIALKATPAAADLFVIEDSAASWAKKSLRVDALPYVGTARTLTAGAGLTGGGDLSANRTFDVVAHADGSIVVNANDVQVGVLATDAQHGNRGRGSLHTVATAAEAGFMAAADKAKLDSNGANGVLQIDGSSNIAPPGNVTATGYLKTNTPGDLATPSVRVGGDSVGISNPATSQLGLVANGEAVVVDNDAVTPSLRPDVDSVWTLGESATRWANAYVDGLDVAGNIAVTGTVDGRDVSADGATLDALGVLGSSKVFRSVNYAGQPGGNAITLATGLENGDTFEGQVLATGNVVLLTNQASAIENGPWVVAASGAPSRPSWFPAGGSAAGAMFFVESGYMANRTVRCISAKGSDVIGTNNLTFEAEARTHRGKSAAPTTANDWSQGYISGDVWLWETVDESRSFLYIAEDGGSPVWRESTIQKDVIQLGTSTFSLDASHRGAVCQWTGTSTGVAGTVNQSAGAQVTTLVLTGTAGTITLTAGSGMTLEAEKGKTLTTLAPGASDVVTVSIIWLSATYAIATGGLA